MARIGVRRVILACFLLVASTSCATRSWAAQALTLPSQQSSELQPSPPPLVAQPEERPLRPPKLPAPQGNIHELPLPEVFRGCWSGSVPRVDSIRPLSPDAGRLIWLTKVYTLCYKQAGYAGRWRLTFAEGTVADRHEVTDQRQLIKVKSVSGADRAELTAYLHFRTHLLMGLGGVARPSTLDELAHLHCEVLPGRDLMAVSAVVFVETNGEPYADVSWHSKFFRALARNGEQ
jgi:hypothetical protein